MSALSSREKRGFTIVELVIVIAVIAVLAAVLIPTFSTLIYNAHEANDITLAGNVNEQLGIAKAEKGTPEAEDLVTVLQENGHELPLKNQADKRAFYWVPAENRVALVDTETNAAVFPKDLEGTEKAADWVCLSAAPTEPEEPTPAEPEEPTPTEPEEPTPTEPEEPTPTEPTEQEVSEIFEDHLDENGDEKDDFDLEEYYESLSPAGKFIVGLLYYLQYGRFIG